MADTVIRGRHTLHTAAAVPCASERAWCCVIFQRPAWLCRINAVAHEVIANAIKAAADAGLGLWGCTGLTDDSNTSLLDTSAYLVGNVMLKQTPLTLLFAALLEHEPARACPLVETEADKRVFACSALIMTKSSSLQGMSLFGMGLTSLLANLVLV